MHLSFVDEAFHTLKVDLGLREGICLRVLHQKKIASQNITGGLALNSTTRD